MPTSTTTVRYCPPRDLHAEEEGMLSLASLFVVLAFLVLIGLMANVGLTTSRKLETQNAADSVAYSGAVEMARGMNSVTAVNHLIGELMAMVVLIHTLGGDELDQGKDGPSTPFGLDEALDVAYDLAEGVGFDALPQPYGDAYDEASQDSSVGGAIYDARMRLKMVLAWAYEAHFFGGVIAKGQYIPIVGPILKGLSIGVCSAALAFEVKVYQECKTLDALEQMAQKLETIKEKLRDTVVPALYKYQTVLVNAAPFQAVAAANATASPNLTDVSLYPPWPLLQLPVMTEPDSVSVERSQLMRATTPWVQWWRQPWIDFGKDALLLSRFGKYFEDRSTQYTLSIIKKQRDDNDIKLYVMKPDPQGSGNTYPKTYEPWTYAAQSSQVDQMFTVVGMAHRRAAIVAGSGIFRQENPQGMVCYAQAMFYNANPQRRGSGDDNTQPTAGWDTLNWDGTVAIPEYPGPAPQSDDTSIITPSTPQPLIRLNWQSKLVPTTRLTEASAFQRGAIGDVLRRTIPESPLGRTH